MQLAKLMADKTAWQLVIYLKGNKQVVTEKVVMKLEWISGNHPAGCSPLL